MRFIETVLLMNSRKADRDPLCLIAHCCSGWRRGIGSFALVSAIVMALLRGQTATQVDLRTQAKSVDFSAAIATKPLKSGSILPATCSVGEMYYKTDAPAGGNVYGCVALNTWALQSGGALAGDVSGPANAATVTQIQGRAIAATAPSGGQSLTWNGSTSRWEPQTVSGGSGNATQIQGRNIATATPSDTNVLCWSTTNSWWGPCVSGGITNPFTFPGKFTAAASGVGAASFAIPAGVAPSAPLAGDVWNVAGALQFHNGSAAKTIAFLDSSITGTAAGITGKTTQGNGSLLLLGSGSYSAGNVTSIDANGNVVDGGVAVANIVRTGSTYADPAWITSLAKGKVGLGNVENTALSGWAGSGAITALGTIASGTWQGTAIGASYIADLSGTYQAVSGKNAAGGYAGLDGSSRIAKAQAPSATVYTDGSYADPSWITSLAASKVGSGTAQWNANRINGTLLSGLATGLLKNTTATGVPSIATGTGAVASADYIAPSILSASQDILYRNGTDLARLPIVTLNKCLGNSGGVWASLDCGAGSGGVGDPGGNGIVVRTALNTTTNRSIAPGTGITVSNGDGQSGNPIIAADTTVLATQAMAQGGSFNFAVPSGTTSNKYRAALTPLPTGYSATVPCAANNICNGTVAWFKADVANTGSASFDAGGLSTPIGDKVIYKWNGSSWVALAGGDIAQNSVVGLVYNTSLNTGLGGWEAFSLGAAGGGSMVYPTGSGIPVVASGASWGTTLSPSTAGSIPLADGSGWGALTISGDVNISAAGVATVKQIHNTTLTVNAAASPVTIPASASFIPCDASGGPVVLNLPAATNSGREITIKKTDATTNACTPTRAGSDTIDGATTMPMTAQYAAVRLVDSAPGTWARSHVNQLGGALSGTNVSASLGRALSFSLGSPTASAALTASDTDYLTVPFACTIVAYNLAIDAADATFRVKVWKVATGTAIPTVSNSISTSGWGVSSGTALHSTTLTDLSTTAVAANDIIAVNVATANTVKFINLVLQCTQ